MKGLVIFSIALLVGCAQTRPVDTGSCWDIKSPIERANCQRQERGGANGGHSSKSSNSGYSD